MTKRIFVYLSILMSFFFCVYCSLSWYVLLKSNINDLIVYCLEPETSFVASGLAQFYLFNFRGNEDDLEFLKNSNGLGFILSDTRKSRDVVFKYVSFFLKKGFDINSVGIDGYTALHGAIVLNQPEDVSFLLKNGADKNVKVGYSRIYGKNEKTKLFGMDAIELANYLSKNDKNDRIKIIKLLTK